MTALQADGARGSRLSFLDALLLLFLFEAAILHAYLFLAGNAIASGNHAAVYIAVAVLAVLCLIGRVRRFISGELLLLLLLFAAVGASYIVTGLRLGTNAIYKSELKAFIAMLVCTLLLTLNIFWRSKTEIHVPLVLALDLVITAVCFASVFRIDEQQTGGLIRDVSGLLYQNIAYYSATCFGLNIFLSKEQQLRSAGANVWMKLLLLGMSAVQILTCFLSGGRGGVILMLLLMLYGLVTRYGIRELHKGVLAAIIAVLLVFVFAPQILSRLHLGSNGLARTLKLFAGGYTDSNRAQMYRRALGFFWEHPIFGNGVGSFLVHRGIYSHNAVTDILCEAGIFGLGLMIFVLIRLFRSAARLYHCGSLYRLLIILFLCGFTMNLFSGYIWVNQQVWLPLTILLSCGHGAYETQTAADTIQENKG